MKHLKVIISGGGTGGHIFPAIAIAKELEISLHHVDILFVGAKDRMEMQKVPESGYNIEGLWISGLTRSNIFNYSFFSFFTVKNLLFPFKLLFSLRRSKNIIKRFKPDLVIGTGGFASGPLLYVANKQDIPTIIQEQNSYPGITNKLLSKGVHKICVAYDNMDKFFPISKIVFTGNPIRKEILNFQDKRKEGRSFFGIENKNITVLVIGGSLGAKTINDSINSNLEYFKNNHLNLIWQTGVSYDDRAKKSVKDLNYKGVRSYKFINRMSLAYAAADIIVSRAGAIAISELCFVGKPVILVPSPNVAEDHQTKNAQSLVNKNSAIMVKDIESRLKLVEEIKMLSENKILQRELSNNIKELSVKDAASKIVDLSLELLK